jgi:membrane protease YdiL (CAAX protease family)
LARPGRAAAFRWCPAALLPAVLSGAVLLAVGALAAESWPDVPALAAFWLSLVPLHVGALGACLAVCCVRAPAGGVGRALDLERPGRGRGWRLLARGLLLVAVLYPVIVGLTVAATVLLAWLGLPPQPSPILQFLLGARTPAAFASVLLTGVVLAPFAEEVLFRLVLYETLRRARVPLPALWAAVLFAGLHATPVEFPGLLVLGLGLQHARKRAGSLWLPIVVHALFNAVSLLLAAIGLVLGEGLG